MCSSNLISLQIAQYNAPDFKPAMMVALVAEALVVVVVAVAAVGGEVLS